MPLEKEDLDQIGTLVAEAITAATPELVKAATAANESRIDERISKAFDPEKITKKILDRVNKGAKGDDDDDDDRSKGRKSSDSEMSARDKAFLRRSLKQSVKDLIAELPESEKAHVRAFALAAADRVALDIDSDEDEIAKELVEGFTATFKTAKTAIEGEVRADLKARNLLLESDEGQEPDGGDSKLSDKKDPKKQYAAGEAIAKEMFGDGKKKE